MSTKESHNNGQDVAIRVNDISKKYLLFEKPSDRLKHGLLWRMSRTYCKEFWALKNISFEVKKGESFGIIGKNGAGKSTLLQIITGTLYPTSGNIETQGKIAALLELGSGFDPEFTGRENVFLNGSILGLSKSDIDSLYDKIVDFADIGDFIDQPLKTYSSGMVVRLAFSVQAFVKPDILIVDEALSVGDIFFSQKCARVMAELKEQGTTILFVSHDLSSVRNLCSRAIYLKNGTIESYGETSKVIQDFYSEGAEKQDSSAPEIHSKTTKSSIKTVAALENIKSNSLLDTSNINSEFFEICAINFFDQMGNSKTRFELGESIDFQLVFRLKQPMTDTHFSISVKNKMDQVMFCAGTYSDKKPPLQMEVGRFYRLTMNIVWSLEAGRYSFSITFGRNYPDRINIGENIFEYSIPEPILIEWDYEQRIPPFFGMVGLNYETDLSEISEQLL